MKWPKRLRLPIIDQLIDAQMIENRLHLETESWPFRTLELLLHLRGFLGYIISISHIDKAKSFALWMEQSDQQLLQKAAINNGPRLKSQGNKSSLACNDLQVTYPILAGVGP